jgi:hypothetical protein
MKRIYFAAVLLLVTGLAQAFSVTVDSASRSVSAAADDFGGGYNYDGDSTALTGDWSSEAHAGVQYASGESDQTSNIRATGEYAVYSIDYSGYARSGGVDYGRGSTSLSVWLTFSEDVFYLLDTSTCQNNISLRLDGGSSIGLCSPGNRVGLIEAGRYRLDMGNTANVSGVDDNGYATGASSRSDYIVSFSKVPVPAAVWLFGSALGALGWVRRRRS